MTDRTSWRDAALANLGLDSLVVLLALASIVVGVRPLAAPLADARPAIAEAVVGLEVPQLVEVEPVPGIQSITPADRPVSAGDRISELARELESTVGRYRAVTGMFDRRTLPCSQLRDSYAEVEGVWTRYSIERGRAYGDRLPERLVRWDEALYEAVREVDRDFNASGCSRL